MLVFDTLSAVVQRGAQVLARLPSSPARVVGLVAGPFGVHFTMHQAAQVAHRDSDTLSFVNAVRLLCHAIPDFQSSIVDDHPARWLRLLNDVLPFRLPTRDNRSNPRVVKRQRSTFDVKRPWQHLPPLPLRPFRQSVILL